MGRVRLALEGMADTVDHPRRPRMLCRRARRRTATAAISAAVGAVGHGGIHPTREREEIIAQLLANSEAHAARRERVLAVEVVVIEPSRAVQLKLRHHREQSVAVLRDAMQPVSRRIDSLGRAHHLARRTTSAESRVRSRRAPRLRHYGEVAEHLRDGDAFLLERLEVTDHAG